MTSYSKQVEEYTLEFLEEEIKKQTIKCKNRFKIPDIINLIDRDKRQSIIDLQSKWQTEKNKLDEEKRKKKDCKKLSPKFVDSENLINQVLDEEYYKKVKQKEKEDKERLEKEKQLEEERQKRIENAQLMSKVEFKTVKQEVPNQLIKNNSTMEIENDNKEDLVKNKLASLDDDFESKSEFLEPMNTQITDTQVQVKVEDDHNTENPNGSHNDTYKIPIGNNIKESNENNEVKLENKKPAKNKNTKSNIVKNDNELKNKSKSPDIKNNDKKVKKIKNKDVQDTSDVVKLGSVKDNSNNNLNTVKTHNNSSSINCISHNSNIITTSTSDIENNNIKNATTSASINKPNQVSNLKEKEIKSTNINNSHKLNNNKSQEVKEVRDTNLPSLTINNKSKSSKIILDDDEESISKLKFEVKIPFVDSTIKIENTKESETIANESGVANTNPAINENNELSLKEEQSNKFKIELDDDFKSSLKKVNDKTEKKSEINNVSINK